MSTRIAMVAATFAIVAAAVVPASAQNLGAAALIAAGKSARVSAIDLRKRECNDTRTVERWLKDTVGISARSVRWSGGACRLVDQRNPRDAGTRWCAQATIAPKRGGKPATIEVFFERPIGGRPGEAFAFRALVHTKDGADHMRETQAFEINWGETYIPGYKAPESGGC